MVFNFDKEIYRKISISNLIIFSIYSIYEKKGKCSFSDLVEECFASFPEKFFLAGIKKWPDSRKFDRPLRHLRRKKLIISSPNGDFKLTKTGEKIAKETARIFRQERLGI